MVLNSIILFYFILYTYYYAADIVVVRGICSMAPWGAKLKRKL
uniref:Uncharacterized protein n=1 Tax=Anguilla anguilla TaxID=7936 RepID=A0A0E9UFT9_ANGAN